MEPVKFQGMNTNYVSEGCDDLPTMVEKNESGWGGDDESRFYEDSYDERH